MLILAAILCLSVLMVNFTGCRLFLLSVRNHKTPTAGRQQTVIYKTTLQIEETHFWDDDVGASNDSRVFLLAWLVFVSVCQRLRRHLQNVWRLRLMRDGDILKAFHGLWDTGWHPETTWQIETRRVCYLHWNVPCLRNRKKFAFHELIKCLVKWIKTSCAVFAADVFARNEITECPKPAFNWWMIPF